MIRRLISEDISIKMNLPPYLPRINADPGQIEQIIINLIVNARDAINQNTKNVTNKKITIETGKAYLDESYIAKHLGSRAGLHVYISLSDTGIGMTDDVKQKVFEPFFTTKGKGEGTGLGLSTVYGIVKQNKGSIYIYSETGEGTTFKIYWPSSDEDLSQDVSKDIDEDKLRGSETILFVEDDKEVRDFACTSLKNFSYQIHSASNGKKAFKLTQG